MRELAIDFYTFREAAEFSDGWASYPNGTVDGPRLAECLGMATDGPGALRRFKDVLATYLDDRVE